jgi:tyrosine ammonia-lyase
MIKWQIELDSFLEANLLRDLAINEGASISLSQEVQGKVNQSHTFLLERINSGDWIYGYSSGFGPLAHENSVKCDNIQHQKNLLYHLATGQGENLSLQESRAVLALRIRQLALGFSGASLATLLAIIELFNKGFAAAIPALGSVGASGDLTPLSHLALSLSGEGEVYKNGSIIDSQLWFAQNGLNPIVWQEREALAFVNGTACMTALAALNLVQLKKILSRSLTQVFIYAEMLSAYREAWNPLLAQARPHKGQKLLSETLFNWSLESDFFTAEQQYQTNDEFSDKLPQDAYSIRCAPQLLGAVHDDYEALGKTIDCEINSASDNPTIFALEKQIIHGGNFNGQHIAFASDSLNQKLVYLAIYAEKRISKICDPKHNMGLSAFLKPTPLGLNSGFMGAQVTSTALLANLKLNSKPVSLETMATNGDNQDMISMGTLSAWRGREMLSNVFAILAIEAMILAEAIDQRQVLKKRKMAALTEDFYKDIRTQVPPLKKDRPLSKEIKQLASVFFNA